MTFNRNEWKKSRYANRTPEEVERDKEYRRKYYLANRAKAKAKATAYRANNKEAIKAYRESRKERDKLLRMCHTYGIAEERGLELIQSKQCPICGVELVWNGNTSNSLAVDHCHESGEVRDAICQSCNKMLGFAKDNPETLIRAAQYLNHHQEA